MAERKNTELIYTTGAVLKADVVGHIEMKALLSGMPECKFGLNDSLLLHGAHNEHEDYDHSSSTSGAVALQDCQFHQCVKLGQFDAERIISFVPPDGSFELMRYRAVENVNLPFKVITQVTEVGKLKVDYSITVSATFGNKLYATDVVLNIPTPLNTSETDPRTTHGKAKYDPSENRMVWKIGRFAGKSEYSLHATATLSSTVDKKVWSRPPITMDFKLAMFTSSGIVVRYLKIFERSNYTTVKWIRYQVKAGSYEIRVSIDFSDFWPFLVFTVLTSAVLSIIYSYLQLKFSLIVRLRSRECCYVLLRKCLVCTGENLHRTGPP